MSNGGVLGRRNVPGVDGFSGVWSLREIANMRRKFYAPVALALGPTALYMMEEGSGTQMTDSSGNANHGTYINGALPSSPGLWPQSTKSLNATSNLYATAPGAVASATSGFSIVAWLQWSHASNLVVCERNQNAGYSIQTRTDGRIGITSTNSGTPQLFLQSALPINNDLPHCCVFSFGTTPANCKLYVDGVDATSVVFATITPTYGATTVWDIGSRAGTVTMNGRLDGVMFVPSLLTLAQAKALSDSRHLNWPA